MKTILVVDDEPAIRDVLLEILRDEGYGTVAAQDGLSALDLLEGMEIDLVIIDTMMPRRGGVELLQSMRGDPRLRDVPAILMSAAARPQLDGLGVSVFLPKPFELDDLLDAVSEAIG